MAWFYLGVAGLLEIVWAAGLKSSAGSIRVVMAGVTMIAFIGSFYFLARALQHIPIGTGYAAWTGIGIVGTTILGIVVFGEGLSMLRAGSLALILIGITGLKLAS